MRTIKFRVWDVKNKRFYIPNGFINQWPVLHPNGLLGFYGEFHEYTYGNEVDQKDYRIELFTGFIDSEGEEIYENDVCHYKGNDIGMYYPPADVRIVWDENGYYVLGPNFKWTLDSKFCKESLTLIKTK